MTSDYLSAGFTCHPYWGMVGATTTQEGERVSNELPPCREVDPEIFFPPTDKVRNMYGELGKELVATTIVALDSCARCFMKDKCLQFAIDNREAHGIWAGTFPHEREQVAPIPAGISTNPAFHANLRRAVLRQRKDLICPPLPKPQRERTDADAWPLAQQ